MKILPVEISRETVTGHEAERVVPGGGGQPTRVRSAALPAAGSQAEVPARRGHSCFQTQREPLSREPQRVEVRSPRQGFPVLLS